MRTGHLQMVAYGVRLNNVCTSHSYQNNEVQILEMCFGVGDIVGIKVPNLTMKFLLNSGINNYCNLMVSDLCENFPNVDFHPRRLPVYYLLK